MSVVADFVNVNSWFEQKYAVKSASRWPTMKAALNLTCQRVDGTKPLVIGETGCVRLADDYGAGYSTVMFADFCRAFGGHVYSVDISPTNVATCRGILDSLGLGAYATVICGDSVEAIRSGELGNHAMFDLLYLDSYDYPLCEADGPTDPPQRHCLAEAKAGLPRMSHYGLMMFDDNNLPGGGKPKLAKEFLASEGCECILDAQQSLWFL